MNESLQFGLEAAREVWVTTMGSNRGLQIHDVETVDQADIFKGAPKALRGAKLLERSHPSRHRALE
jgi:hypothetical protein